MHVFFFFVVVIIILNINAGSTLITLFLLLTSHTHTQKTKLQNTNTKSQPLYTSYWACFWMCVCAYASKNERLRREGKKKGGKKKKHQSKQSYQGCAGLSEPFGVHVRESEKKSGGYCAGAALKASRRHPRMPFHTCGDNRLTSDSDTVTISLVGSLTCSVLSQIIDKLANGWWGGGIISCSWWSSGKREKK